MRLVAADGRSVRGRCGATNKCSYCAKLGSIETAEMLALDAVNFFAPEVWLCLGTRTASFDPKPFYRGRDQVQKALRRRWPDLEVANLREFTTGYGPRSGGRRRPHWNFLIKGVVADQVEELRDVAARVWCGRVDAEPDRQYAGTVHDAGGLMRYLALHFQKQSQAPPPGWRGHRFTSSRGYFPEGSQAARERARRSLRLGRAVHWANAVAEGAWQDEGVILTGDELEELVEAYLDRAAGASWQLKKVRSESSDPGVARAVGARRPFRRKVDRAA
jgi:hypothetical protein